MKTTTHTYYLNLFIVSLFVFSFVSNASHAQIAYYPFSGNANDISGNSHNGTVNGAILSADKNSNPANAYSFNGSGQSISIPYHADFNIAPSGQFTISLWVKPASSNSNARALFVKSSNGSSAFNSVWDYGVYLITNNTIMIGYANNHVCFSATQLQAGHWYCVSATYNNGDWKIYINGALDAQSLASGHYITQSTNGIGIGRKGDASFDFFDGQLDDIRFFNTALTASQVSNVCASFVGIQENDLAGARFEIFPNPSNGSIHISSAGYIFHGKVRVLNMLGNTIDNEEFTGMEKNLNCVLSRGIYLIQVTDETSIVSKRIIVD